MEDLAVIKPLLHDLLNVETRSFDLKEYKYTSISRISVAPRILENHFSFSTAGCKYHQFFNIFA